MHFLLLLIALVLPLQENKLSTPDSLKNQLSSVQTDSLKATTLLALAKYYYLFDQDSALFYTDQLLSLGAEKTLPLQRAHAMNIAGVSLLIKSDFENALQNHLQALKIRQELQDSTGIMESYLNIGNIYYRSDDAAKGIENYQAGLAIALQLNHERALSLLYNNLGSVFLDRWKVGNNQNDFDQAREYLENSKAIKEKLQDWGTLINTLNLLGEMLLENGELKEGEDLLKQALEISEKEQDYESRIAILLRFSIINQTRKNYSESMRFAKQAYELALQMKSPFQIRLVSYDISSLAAEMKDFKQAFEYLEIYVANSDSLYNESRQKIRDELFIQYETEKKELENQKLLKEQQLSDLSIRRKNELLLGLLSAALILFIFVLTLRKNNHKLKTANTEIFETNEKLQQQQAQIQEQTEILSRKNQELNKANKFRDKLFSIISHDLRSPFNSIQGSMILWGQGDLSKEEMDEVLSLINKENENAYSMLDNLLNWARVQISSEQVTKSLFLTTKLIEENFKLFDYQAKAKNIQLEHTIHPKLKWNTDQDRLNFILRNILKNAIKFSPKGGQIVVSADEHSISIKDFGVGMSPAQLEKLYSDNQYSTVGTEGESGTGIGFILSRDFAESIGAEILVHSEPGTGTTFTIHLKS